MPYLFALLFLVTGILWLRQLYNAGKQRRLLKEITDKLEQIITTGSSEKMLIFTDDTALIPLLIQINHLLNYNQKIIAGHAQTEMAMRKMLSNISHDLKTPLTVINGYLETLSEEAELTAETKAKLEKSHLKSKELLALIQEFFSLAKIESGDETFPLSKLNLNEICRKNVLQFYPILSENEWQVSVEIPDDSIMCLANEKALDRILSNLISNAIAYGNDGKTLGIRLRKTDSSALIEVWDKGKGIAEHSQERIFERLYTLEDSRNKNYQGSGLGLTISRRLANVLGGDISVQSIPYEKTSFTVSLPL